MNALRVKFPWARIMQLGLGTLRLSPEQFWRSTAREIFSAFGPASQPMLRQKLDELIERFPD